MTNDNMNKTRALRMYGFGYKKIAEIIGLNAGTIKTHCIWHGLNRDMPAVEADTSLLQTKPCANCGSIVFLYPGRKAARFCFMIS